MVLGAPIALQDALINISFLIITVIINQMGVIASASLGVVEKIIVFAMLPPMAISSAVATMTAQNYGAGLHERTRTALRYSIITCAVLGVLWTALPEAFPNVIIRLFMTPTESVLAAAPRIVRIYSISFLLLPFNVYSTYYFQATMKTRTSMAVSIARGIVISGALILALPAVAGGDAVWFAMPITEALVAAYAALRMIRPARTAH